MAQNDSISKVAIIGASGHIGKHFVQELIKTGKHTVTAITRPESKGVLPEGVNVAKINYEDDADSLVSVLKEQQFLIITLGVRAPPDLHGKIVKAAATAGVPYVMPNIYGYDYSSKGFAEGELYTITTRKAIAQLEEAGVPYVAIVCGFWYEWSLAMGEQWFGFEIGQRKVTLFDDGNTRINCSTWVQCGRALAALLSLPESGASPSLSDWKNKPFYFDSFTVSQRDMLDSLHRVLDTTDQDWDISYEPTEKRYKDGLAEYQKGIITGFAKALYARIFLPTGDGLYESKGLSNELLNLPNEDLDEATKRAVDMVESGWKPHIT